MISRDQFDALRGALGGISPAALRGALKKAGINVIPRGRKPVRVEVTVQCGNCKKVEVFDHRRAVIDCDLAVNGRDEE